MDWEWRVDYIPNNKSEYNHVRDQLLREQFDMEVVEKFTGKKTVQRVPFYKLPHHQQAAKIKAQLKGTIMQLLRANRQEYCKKIYKKAHVVETLPQTSTVCKL